jgi:hypothetical protein
MIAFLWTFMLLIELSLFAKGESPSWTFALCPTIVLVVEYWLDYFGDDN